MDGRGRCGSYQQEGGQLEELSNGLHGLFECNV